LTIKAEILLLGRRSETVEARYYLNSTTPYHEFGCLALGVTTRHSTFLLVFLHDSSDDLSSSSKLSHTQPHDLLDV
jgi:hypothetical protein